MQPPPLAQQLESSPPAATDEATGPDRRRRRRLRPLHGMALIGLVAAAAFGRPSPSSWIGGGVIVGADAAAIPIAAAPQSGAALGRGAFGRPFGSSAFVGAPAAGRASGPRSERRRSEGHGIGQGPATTVCWDTKGGAGPEQGPRGRFAPFKSGALASLARRPASAPTPIQPPATVAAAAQGASSGGVGGGLQRIWDAVQGKNLDDGTGSGGGGSNTAFKVLLATVAFVYGSNFGAIKYLDEANVDVSIVTAIRFALASGALAPFLFRAPRHIIERGLEVGVWVAFGYLTQAIGLQDTQASKSAFICSLSVVVVPIVNAIVYKKRPPPATWLASILAVIGVGMLTLEGDLTPSVGDLWSLGQPLGFGVAFVRTEQCMSQNKDQALAMTAAQMLGVFACAFIWVSFTLTAKTPDLSVLWEPTNIAALVYTGIITSALAVVAESVALAHVSAEETTVILSTEPLWAALFGAAVLGEKLDALGYVGGLVILAGCILTQAKLPPAFQSKLEAVFGPGDVLEGEGEG